MKINRNHRIKIDRSIRITFVLAALFMACVVTAQQKAADTNLNNGDSIVGSSFVTRIQKMGKAEAVRSIETFKKGRDAIKQEELIEEIKQTTLKAKAHLKSGVDTFGISAELKNTNAWIAIAGDGVFTNTGTAQTYRNLVTTSKILVELLKRTNNRKTQVDLFEKALVNYRYKIDSLNADTVLYDFPSDSVVLMRYVQKILVLAGAIGPADSALKQAVINVNTLQIRIDSLVNKLNSSL